MNTRQIKGQEIAARLKIQCKDNQWIVPSQTGKGKYTVDIEGKEPHCTCPDFELRGYKYSFNMPLVLFTATQRVETFPQHLKQ